MINKQKLEIENLKDLDPYRRSEVKFNPFKFSFQDNHGELHMASAEEINKNS